jgi:hypothetical protein
VDFFCFACEHKEKRKEKRRSSGWRIHEKKEMAQTSKEKTGNENDFLVVLIRAVAMEEAVKERSCCCNHFMRKASLDT